ncbi:MAG: acetolactate synthase small subunit [Nitrososphaeria archaeon]|nr:acetolactate synthase small subunit [Nitrososphaeria archaeon]NIN53281.1 acetolactate synthase small subunit [Nitrososphaeria archaeon]NIQ33732.1 acetolactate synthase small subunit [Nitrososphaeria archaeon]
MSEEEQTFTISAKVEHKPGVLFQVSNLFRRRGFNIESISIGPAGTEKSDVAYMTITMRGQEADVEQLIKQLMKLIDVIEVVRLYPKASVARELALIKLRSDAQSRSDIFNCVSAFRGNIIDVSSDSIIAEIVGSAEKIDAFIELTGSFGLIEVSRTGVTALTRGSKSIGFEE